MRDDKKRVDKRKKQLSASQRGKRYRYVIEETDCVEKCNFKCKDYE